MSEDLAIPSVRDRRRRLLLRLIGRTALYLLPVFLVSLLLMSVSVTYTDGTPTPLGVLQDLWDESLDADEEIFLLLALAFWTLTWSYGGALAAVLRGRGPFGGWVALLGIAIVTPCAAGLERAWRPHGALGNAIVAAAVSAAFVGVWCVHLRRVVAAGAATTD